MKKACRDRLHVGWRSVPSMRLSLSARHEPPSFTIGGLMEPSLDERSSARDMDAIEGQLIDHNSQRVGFMQLNPSLLSAPRASIVSMDNDDLKPVQMLVELHDLDLNTDEGEWLETARWIKYEEDVEGAGHHWGQPHVAFLSFHALIQLRRCFLKGILVLDLQASSFDQLCEGIKCALIAQGASAAYADDTINILRLKHLRPHSRHLPRISTAANALFERRCNGVRQERLQSSASAAPVFDNAARCRKNLARPPGVRGVHSFVNLGEENLQAIPDEGDLPAQTDDVPTDTSGQPLLKRSRPSHSDVNSSHASYPKKQAENGESAQVFAGTVPQLDRACFIMVRLLNAEYIPELVEESGTVRFVFVILGPLIADVSYYELGRSISTLIANKTFNKIAYEANDRSQLIEGIDQFLDDSVVIPPGEIDSKRLVSGDELKKALKKRNRRKMIENERVAVQKKDSTMSANSSRSPKDEKKLRFFDGMVRDIRRRLPFYWSDIRDAFRFKCLTSIIFMFFASFAPAITFGGLLGKYTDEKIGTMETLLAQCICGIIWGLFAAQPLLIMSATGPVLIFEASLYTFCKGLDLDFMTVRLYAGFWVMGIALVVVALDGSRLLVYVTRFTEDIFASLISIIFIAESTRFVYETFVENPVEDYTYYRDMHIMCGDEVMLMKKNASSLSISAQCNDAEPNTALLTAIILFSTFSLSYAMRQLRQSFYLGRTLRQAIGDFGVLISIAFVALTVHLLIPDPYLARLDMPDHIDFTNFYSRGHGLVVSGYLPTAQWWAILVALVAAMLVFILLFVETEITELLLSRRDRGLVKGTGMHWDLVLMGICTVICSVFGLPWMCAAAVQSLAHCGSLTVMKKAAPGERPEVDHVIEQRITTIGVSVLIGLITLAGPYLRLPLASLFGVFLYLGVMNLSGVQLVQRTILFFIPSKYFPSTDYTETVSVWRIHYYTTIQLVCLLAVYMVKNIKEIALAFPFVLMLFVIIRQVLLPKVFDEPEIKALDGEEEQSDDEWIEKDFYENAPIPV